ncbi:FxSxx-COOH cyclophane-containing RiPP peptide [Thermopolyspora sp. NPDC052614]|uniref:FxSxx-COOH cyclophane-containing RiPP peptide n=1 Tax=Thermopolyspora sp. NPDC052614 TaxID=3155682 RepID=UPI00343266C8
MTGDSIGLETDLIDASGLSLNDITKFDDSILGHALHRILQEAGGTDDPIAEFDASI